MAPGRPKKQAKKEAKANDGGSTKTSSGGGTGGWLSWLFGKEDAEASR